MYTWFATGTEMFTSEDTKQQKKFALLQNKFALLQNKFAFWQNKFTFWPKKVYILVNKFTTFIKKLPKSLHKVNHANLVNFSEKFTPLRPPMYIHVYTCIYQHVLCFETLNCLLVDTTLYKMVQWSTTKSYWYMLVHADIYAYIRVYTSMYCALRHWTVC